MLDAPIVQKSGNAPILTFAPMTAADFMTIDRQPSQRMFADGEEPTWDDARRLADQDDAWAVRDDEGRLLACLGILETIEGRSGMVWALLAEGIGRYHLRITRFSAQRILACPLPRLEAIARCIDVEPLVELRPWLDPVNLLDRALDEATPPVRWARRLGLRPVHVLRRYSSDGGSYVLFERIA